MVDLEDLLLEDLLVVSDVRRLVEKLAVHVDLEQVRLHAADDVVPVLSDGELNLYLQLLASDRVDELSLVHFPERLVEQHERQRVEDRALACAVLTDDESGARLVELELRKRVACGKEVLIAYMMKNYSHLSISFSSFLSMVKAVNYQHLQLVLWIYFHQSIVLEILYGLIDNRFQLRI